MLGNGVDIHIATMTSRYGGKWTKGESVKRSTVEQIPVSFLLALACTGKHNFFPSGSGLEPRHGAPGTPPLLNSLFESI